MFSALVPERRVITVGIDYDVIEPCDPGNMIPGTVFVVGSDNGPNVQGLNDFYTHAWPLIKNGHPAATLRIVGKLGRAFRGLADVEWVGWTERIEDEYAKAAVVINPTRIGTGLKIKTVEALCNGKAFVGTPNSVEGLPETEHPPFIVAGDWPAFAYAVLSLLQSEEKRRALEQKAVSYARLHFSREATYAPLAAALAEHPGEASRRVRFCPLCHAADLKPYGTMRWTVWDVEYRLVQCGGCRSAFTDPMPDDATLKRLYETAFDYRWYQDHYGAKLLDCQQRIEEYRPLMGRRVLDFGGGLGYFSQIARKEGYDSVTYDPYTSHAAPPGNDWDTVVALHALEHSNDPDKTIRLIKRHLLPGGKLILAVPNFDSEGYRKLGTNWVWAQPPLLHVFHFTAEGLQCLLERHGFTDVTVSYHERWDANLHADLEERDRFAALDAEWGAPDVNSSPVKRALVAWRNSLLRVEALERAVEQCDPGNRDYAELQVTATYGTPVIVKIGVINQDPSTRYRPDIAQFEISKKELSFSKLFHSAFATPGRYIMELFCRLSSIGNTEPILIFNPFFKLPPAIIERVLEETKRVALDPYVTVFADRHEAPLAYFLPKGVSIAEARFLSLLSAMHAEVDSAYLRNALLEPSRCVYLNSVVLNKSAAHNEFHYNENYDRIYTWVTDSALLALSKHYGNPVTNDTLQRMQPREKAELRRRRNAIPFVAIMPHHAGDVLFLSIALRNSMSNFRKVVVSEWYRDILAECAPATEVLSYPFTPTLRNGVTTPDEEYFFTILHHFKLEDIQNHFYYYCRPSREYRISDFHLIDHYYFALGASLQSKGDLLCSRPIASRYLPDRTGSAFRILLHTEGGWPLKTYPETHLKVLIEKFRRKGYQITLLSSRPHGGKNVKTVPYSNLKHFRELLSSHHLLIGMDSFPVHYAAHIMGSPAICLFGNTKPVNSDAPVSDHYRYLIEDMDCPGCFGFNRCPKNGKPSCDNFPKPETIFDSAVAMLDELYNRRGRVGGFEQAYAQARNMIGHEPPEKAIARYEKLLEAHPEKAVLYGDLGVLHHSLQDKEKAGLCYERAVSLQPENDAFRKNLAGFYFSEMGRADDAIQIYLDLLKARPHDVESLLILGNICALAGRSAEAQIFYHKVLAVAPGNRNAWENLEILRNTEDSSR
ncbi:MAG: methyltransferase domain-containing protein [Syntrophaceae bacterium]|nr:methyltransferase domain-containing protein [Syntrophaceae bacterium]